MSWIIEELERYEESCTSSLGVRLFTQSVLCHLKSSAVEQDGGETNLWCQLPSRAVQSGVKYPKNTAHRTARLTGTQSFTLKRQNTNIRLYLFLNGYFTQLFFFLLSSPIHVESFHLVLFGHVSGILIMHFPFCVTRYACAQRFKREKKVVAG